MRTILLNPRYRGVYLHGRIKKLRQHGASCRVKADPREVIETEIPEWRIVDDATWFAVNAWFTTCEPTSEPTSTVKKKPASKHALTGLGRCAKCGGAIVSQRVARSAVALRRPWPTDAHGTATGVARSAR